MYEFEIRHGLGAEEFDKLNQESVKRALKDDFDLVECPCGNLIEVVQGEVVQVKKEDGKAITKTAAQHMSKFRVRCPECGSNFCVKCKAAPYHLGQSCEQFEKAKHQKKCRFCKAPIKNNRGNVCTLRECKALSW